MNYCRFGLSVQNSEFTIQVRLVRLRWQYEGLQSADLFANLWRRWSVDRTLVQDRQRTRLRSPRTAPHRVDNRFRHQATHRGFFFTRAGKQHQKHPPALRTKRNAESSMHIYTVYY